MDGVVRHIHEGAFMSTEHRMFYTRCTRRDSRPINLGKDRLEYKKYLIRPRDRGKKKRVRMLPRDS